MKLYLASAIGRGSTELGAFDAALFRAGVANLNLVRLSSVIPPGSDIVQVERCPFEQNGRWGDRLYAVYAEQRTTTPGEQVWAGVGWCQDRETGQGLFVEHHGDREQPVRDQITASLTDLQAIRGLDLGPIHKCVVGAMCVGTPTCALVICGYATESWHTDDNGTTATLASRRDHDPSAQPLHVPDVSSWPRARGVRRDGAGDCPWGAPP